MKNYIYFWVIALISITAACYYKPVYNGKPIPLWKLKRAVQHEHDYTAFMTYMKDAWRQDSIANYGSRLYIGGLMEERFDFGNKPWPELRSYLGKPNAYSFAGDCYVYFYNMLVDKNVDIQDKMLIYVCNDKVNNLYTTLDRKKDITPLIEKFIIIPNLKNSFAMSGDYKSFLSDISEFWQLDSLGHNGFRLMAADILIERFDFKGKSWEELYGYLGKANFVSDYGDGCVRYTYILGNGNSYYIVRYFYVKTCNGVIEYVNAKTMDG